jgi:hypothetical protein
MTLEDLEYIFKPQIEEGTTKLYFMLIDGEHKVIERHDASDMVSLVPMLDNFQYAGTEGRMPRFVK